MAFYKVRTEIQKQIIFFMQKSGYFFISLLQIEEIIVMKILAPLFVLIFSCYCLHAQKTEKWHSGYVVLKSNDTISGYIRYYKIPSHNAVTFKEKNKKKRRYSAIEILSYTIDSLKYESIEYNNRHFIVKPIAKGNINVYELKKNLYYQKGNQDLYPLKDMAKRSILLELFVDDNELLKKVQNDTHISYSEAIAYIELYNNRNVRTEQINISFSASQIDSILDTNLHLFYFKLKLIGIATEIGFTHYLTLYAEGGTGFYAYFSTEGSDANFVPYVHLQPRIFTNIKKRAAQGKRINNYTGNFIALNYQYDFSPHEFESYTIGPGVGYQKSFGNDFFLSIDAGVGYTEYINTKNDRISPILHMHIGIYL